MDSLFFDSHKKPRNTLWKLGLRTLNYSSQRYWPPRRADPPHAEIDYGVTMYRNAQL